MRIAVLVKSVPDTAGTPEISPDGGTVETGHLEFVLNPYDEFAVEEAVRLKETIGAEVTAVSLGGEKARRALRAAFAMGVDSGVLVLSPAGAELTGRGAAICLAGVLRELAPDLVLAGRQAVDDDGAQVAERIAELLGYQHASAVTRLALEGDRLVVDREIEGGHLEMEMPLPAVVTAEKGLNTPRYPALPQVLKAKRKEIREVAPAGAEGELAARWMVAALTIPRQERRRQVFAEAHSGVERVAGLLRQGFLN